MWRYVCTLVVAAGLASHSQAGAPDYFTETGKDFTTTSIGPVLVHYFPIKNTTKETINLGTGERTSFRPQPSRAKTIRGGFAMLASFFPIGKDTLARIEEEMVAEIMRGSDTKTALFNDQYLATSGQLYELMMGHDRMVADVRSLLYDKFRREGKPTGHCCHPYDACTILIAEEIGIIITDGRGQPLDAPLVTTKDISWIGYANQASRDEVEPVLLRLLEKYELR